MIRIAICDDDVKLCNRLEEYLLKTSFASEFTDNIDIYYSGEQLIKALECEDKYDILLLDVSLGGIDGIEVRKIIRQKLRDIHMEIIYMSADKDNIWNIAAEKSSGFLVKPINIDRLEYLLSESVKVVRKQNPLFYYRKARILNSLHLDSIYYFETFGKKVKIITENEVVEFYESLSNIVSKRLPRFIKISSSHYVNFKYIDNCSLSTVFMKDGKQLPISNSQRQHVKKRMIKLTGQEANK